MQINPERLIGDMRELASFGQYKTGVNRPAFSTEDMASRAWLREKMAAGGLSAVIDDVGNVYGRMDRTSRAILIGSHSDTVPYGGWLDGSLGVIYALEIARCVAESGASTIGVDAISFQDEEGTFLGLLGSRAFCGEDVAGEVAKARAVTGVPLPGVMADLNLAANPPVRLDPARHIAYLEAHIEQGPRLEHVGRQIGVVSAIVGIKTFRITFHGEANHAGTTPMEMRRDAGAAALAFGAAFADFVPRHGSPETVWNVGKVTFQPGAANVVPAAAELIVQIRDASPAVLKEVVYAMSDCVRACAARARVTSEIAPLMDTAPAAMDGSLAALIEQAAGELGASTMSLPSGAGHDAMVLSRHVPSAMLFVPSIGGRSHHVSEDTSEADIVRGARVLLRAVELVMSGRT